MFKLTKTDQATTYFAVWCRMETQFLLRKASLSFKPDCRPAHGWSVHCNIVRNGNYMEITTFQNVTLPLWFSPRLTFLSTECRVLVSESSPHRSDTDSHRASWYKKLCTEQGYFLEVCQQNCSCDSLRSDSTTFLRGNVTDIIPL